MVCQVVFGLTINSGPVFSHNSTHRIHVWYTCLYLPYKNQLIVVKFDAIHGSYGIWQMNTTPFQPQPRLTEHIPNHILCLQDLEDTVDGVHHKHQPLHDKINPKRLPGEETLGDFSGFNPIF